MQDTIIAILVLVGGCLIIWLLGRVIEKLTGLPVWGDPFWGSGRTPKP